MCLCSEAYCFVSLPFAWQHSLWVAFVPSPGATEWNKCTNMTSTHSEKPSPAGPSAWTRDHQTSRLVYLTPKQSTHSWVRVQSCCLNLWVLKLLIIQQSFLSDMEEIGEKSCRCLVNSHPGRRSSKANVLSVCVTFQGVSIVATVKWMMDYYCCSCCSYRQYFLAKQL